MGLNEFKLSPMIVGLRSKNSNQWWRFSIIVAHETIVYLNPTPAANLRRNDLEFDGGDPDLRNYINEKLAVRYHTGHRYNYITEGNREG